MLGFFSFKITNSISLNTITHYAKAFGSKTNMETFTTTMLRLWMKELDEKLSWPLFGLVTQNVHTSQGTTDAGLLATIEFMIKFYATYQQRTQGAKSNKKQTLAVIFALFFTIMQLKDAGMEIKNKCAQCLVQLVNLDLQIFKELV